MISDGTGILLAGGRSRRFGGDKRLARGPGGKPLAVSVLDTLSALFPRVIIAVKKSEDADFLRRPNVLIVEDGATEHHPLAGLVAALDACGTARAFAAAADMPLLQPSLVRALWEMPGAAVLPLRDGRPEPLCAVYARALLPELRRLLDAQAPARTAADLPGARRVPDAEWRPADPEGLSFLDVDTREDLTLLPGLSVGKTTA